MAMYLGLDKVANGGGKGSDYDALPVGAVVEFDGDEIPVGYEEVESDVNNPKILANKADLIYFTPVNCGMHEYYGNCYYYKKGNRVHVHLGLSGLPNSQINVYTLPAGFRPYHALGGAGVADMPGHYAGWEVVSNGNINVHSSYGYMLTDIEFDAYE